LNADMRRPRLLIALASLAVIGAVAPASAAAQAPAELSVRATTRGGVFVGTLEVNRFSVRSAGLTASGRLTGRLRDRRYPSPQRVNESQVSFAVAVASGATANDCARVSLTLGRRAVRLVGLRATFPARTYRLRPRRGGSPALPDLLCATAQTLAAQPPPPAGQPAPPPSPIVVHLLNALRLVSA